MKNNEISYLAKYVRNENKMKNENFSLYTQLNDFNKNFNNIIWSNKLYNYINNIETPPKCRNCENIVKFNRFSTGYSQCCSVKCHLKSSNTKELRRQTNLSRYGVENAFQHKNFKEKIKQTNLIKYGVENPTQSKIIFEKIKQTNLIKYGVENYSQTNEFIEKSKATFLINYGVNSPVKNSTVKEKINKSKEISYAKKWGKILNTSTDNIKILSDDTVLIKNFCVNHNEFEITKFNLINRINRSTNICTQCYPISENSSIKEIEVRNFIENELNIRTEKIKIENREIDIYLSEYMFGIEFNGLYWHSDIYKDNNYHLNKTELCKKHEIQLLHIFEDEWVNKKDIIKNIIKSKLGLIENKIFARKCTIKEIDTNSSQEFLSQNHIHGNIKSKIKIGLFYNNELVSLMTFRKKRFAKNNKINIDGEYETLRFCDKLNALVIDGASKLLSYFIENYKPKSIVTFADRRCGNEELYLNLGFSFVKNTKPNYWYFKIGSYFREYQLNFKRNILTKQGFDPLKTKHQIMDERKYLKIYDCGYIKFEIFPCY